MHAIGIDPGKSTGIAVCKDGELIDLFTADFWDAIGTIELYPDALVVVEKPDSKHVWHDGAKSVGAIQRTGVNVGSVIREAELLIRYLHKAGREHIVRKPAGKIDGAMFKRVTGWSGTTNQHMRDAAMLVFGLKIKSKGVYEHV